MAEMHRRSLSRLGTLLMTMGLIIGATSLGMIVLHPGQRAPWDGVFAAVRQLLGSAESARNLLSLIDGLMPGGMGIALVLGGVILLSATGDKETAAAGVPAVS